MAGLLVLVPLIQGGADILVGDVLFALVEDICNNDVVARGGMEWENVFGCGLGDAMACIG